MTKPHTMTKPKESPKGLDPKKIAEDLREIAREASDLGDRIYPVLDRITASLKEIDTLSLLGDSNTLIDDLRSILFSETVVIKEEQCERCNRRQGEVHGRGGCAAMARIEEARARISQS